ncbi:MAG: carboxypeptidase-like regulatory domain-containing protein [Nitrosotalea sp.]
MSNQYLTLVVLTVAISMTGITQTAFADGSPAITSGPVIPQWIKNNAGWWASGQIGDSDFVKGIQYMVENGIIKIPITPGGNLQNSNQIPSWVKNTAKWWSEGQVDDSEFVKGMQYLVQAGIIQVSIVQPVNQTENMSTQTNQTNEPVSVVPTSCNALDNGVLPDPICTPGAADPQVTQDNIDSTICVSGYASSVRPPVSYTEPLKFKLMDAYGYTDSASNYELDHLIPLEIGGAPADVRNLWPEPHYTTPNSYDKDTLENYLHEQVCSGAIDLKTAQNEIATNWVKYWLEINQNTGTSSNFDTQNDPDGDQPVQTYQNTNSSRLVGSLHVEMQGLDTIARGNVKSMTVIVTDGTNPVSNADVSVNVTYASGETTKYFDGTTDSNGQYIFSWMIGNSSDPGTFEVDVSTSKEGYSSANGIFSFEVTED